MSYLIKKKSILKLLDRLSKYCEVVAPIKKNNDFNFQPISSGKELNLKGYINTRFSPKKYFLPKREILFSFEKSRKIKIKPNLPEEKRIIFGIRPCDVNGLLVLDKIFTTDYEDVVYTKRRENTTLIVVNCKKAGDYCFCGSLGTNELKEGFDLLLTEKGKEYFVEVGSEKGEDIVKNNLDLFKWTKENVKKPKLEFKRKVDAKKLVEKLNKGFNDSIWKKEADRCISCAACTMVCPTCYCYDVTDNTDFTGKKGKIERIWNYCMLLNFTRVAGGHVFRENRTERLKQFVMHKLCYLKENMGVFLCVGCGRCIESCIVDIDLTKIANRLCKK
jgi:ferredoxin